MIEVSVQFAVYFYLLSTLSLIAVFWFLWHSKNISTWEDFRLKGRQPIKNCELCLTRYVDSRGGQYSECPQCSHLNSLSTLE